MPKESVKDITTALMSALDNDDVITKLSAVLAASI